MADRWLNRITTHSLMTVVLFFSYIHDALRETYRTSARELELNELSKNDAGMKRDTNKEQLDSPIPKMPTILRIYFYYSTLSHLLITSKYILVSMFRYHVIPDRELVACYLPGRVSFLYDLSYELPGIAIMMSGSHLVWRSLWYIFNKQLHLESLVFIIIDDEQVQRCRDKLQRTFSRLSSSKREQVYESNRMFCQQIRTLYGRTEYLLRSDRDLNRKRKLDSLVRTISVIMLMNTVFFGTPLTVIMFLNIMSHDYFDINYQECRIFSRRAHQLAALSNDTAQVLMGQQVWSFYDPFRVVMLLVDIFDNFMIIFDSASGLTWPLVITIIVALDLSISIDEIQSRIRQMMKFIADHNMGKEQANLESSFKLRSISVDANQHTRTTTTRRLNDISQVVESEIMVLQSDIMVVFNNVRKVDRYINAFAAYAIIFWVTINVTYEVIYVSRRPVYSFNTSAAWIQVAALILLTVAFAHLGKTHTKTVELYHTCCKLMARDPCIKTTKQGWIWVLEYYHPHRSLFSFHMGWTVLTFANYIKFMLYSITFSLILIDLLRQQLN